jgi:hypothetical protein
VFVMVETEVGDHGAHAAKPAPAPSAAKPAAPAATAGAPAAPKAAVPAAPKPAAAATEHKTAGANPNRALFRRSTYAGVADTGPVPGETFEQKVARLKAVSAGAKQRSEEGGDPGPIHGSAAAATPAAATETTPSASAAATEPVVQSAEITAPTASAPISSPSSSEPHKPTGNADRTLFKRSTYVGVKDTGPVPGETFEQKVARLAAVAAAAKARSEGG